MHDPFEQERSQEARIRREQLERERARRARKRAPRRFVGLLVLALALTGGIRILIHSMGWATWVGTTLVGVMVLLLCMIGLPVALAGGAYERKWHWWGLVIATIRSIFKDEGQAESQVLLEV